jgi:hypothetical protein
VGENKSGGKTMLYPGSRIVKKKTMEKPVLMSPDHTVFSLEFGFAFL